MDQDAEIQSKAEEERQAQVDILTLSLIEKRKAAIEWRRGCGIEDEWQAAEDAYEGIDDANRSTERPVRMSKPINPNGGPTGQARRSGTRSTAFLNITRPYTDAAAARVADMLLPTDDRNFSIEPTPIPEMSQMPQLPNDIPPDDFEKFRQALLAQAKVRAENAQVQIDNWLTECLWRFELRKVIEDSARLGTGVLKGPFPVKRKRKSVTQQDGEMRLVYVQELAPASQSVKPWNFFPDPACGERVDDGDFVFERDEISAKQLRNLSGQPGYLDDALRDCLREGPGKKDSTSHDRDSARDSDCYEVWYFTGDITEADMKAVYKDTDEDPLTDTVRVVATIINDRIVKIARSPLETDSFGFDLMPWQRRNGMPFGIGLAKQIDVPQRMLNAATRNLNDNSALSNGPQIVLSRGVVQPADGIFELVPRKVWFADPESAIDDIRKAFLTFDIPTRQAELMNVIQFALKIAEDVTGLPMLMQGNQGAAPDTVGGMEILNTNANTVLRRIARLFDDCLTEPHIRRYYEWVMEYGEEYQKGDFDIDAHGSTSLVERDIQRQAILGMGTLVLNPAYGLDPEKWAKEALRANKIDPSRLELDDDKKQALQQSMQASQQPNPLQQQAIQSKMALDQAKTQDLQASAAEKNARAAEQQARAQHVATEIAADMSESSSKVALNLAKAADIRQNTESEQKMLQSHPDPEKTEVQYKWG